MEQENSNFGDSDESPIMFRRPISFNGSPLDNDDNLENLHKDLLLYLKKQKNIPRNELKSYLEQLSRMDPQNYKDRWHLKKVKGILKYILKKRSDFTNCLLNGEIDIWSNSFDNSQSNLSSRASLSQDFSMRMLTNNNFMSSDDIKMEVDNYSDPSTQDLFSSSSTQELHNFAQENYQLLKTVVASPLTENVNSQTEDYVFKRPHPVQKVFQIHESLEENFNSIISLAPLDENVNVIETTDESFQNIFDDIYEPDLALKEMREMSSIVRKWVILKSILKLAKIKETPTSQNTANNSSLLLDQGTGNVKIRPLYSEENYKIIKETCEKFKENMKNKEKMFDFLDL